MRRGSPNPARRRVCVVGDILLDVVVRLDGLIQPDSDIYGHAVVGAGGQAANVAAWIVALGGSAAADLRPDELDPAWFEGCGWLHLPAHSLADGGTCGKHRAVRGAMAVRRRAVESLGSTQSGLPANERAWAADTRFPLRS